MAMRHRAAAAASLAHAVNQAAQPGSPGLWQRLRAIPRLVAAVRSGEYTQVSSAKLAMLLAGVGYIVSPIDLVPEGFLLVLGLADDALVLGWVAITLVRETEDFIAWEAQRARAGGWSAAGHAGPMPGDPVTVRSHVIP